MTGNPYESPRASARVPRPPASEFMRFMRRCATLSVVVNGLGLAFFAAALITDILPVAGLAGVSFAVAFALGVGVVVTCRAGRPRDWAIGSSLCAAVLGIALAITTRVLDAFGGL